VDSINELPSKTWSVRVFLRDRVTDRVRIIVLSEIPKGEDNEHNALWHLFSGIEERVVWGAVHDRQHTDDMSTVINQLFESFGFEG